MGTKYSRPASDSVVNESGVTGTTVSDALDTLDTAITAEDLWDRTTSPDVTVLKNTGDNLGVGTITPSKDLTVIGVTQLGNDDIAISQASQVEVIAFGFNYGLGVHRFSNDVSTAIGPTILQTAGGGTPASPTATLSGFLMGGFLVGGVDDAPSVTGAYPTGISVFASENWTAAAQGTYMSATVTPAGATTTVETIRTDSLETVINDDGNSHDFRIEGNTEDNLFITDGSTDRIGVGIAAPLSLLHISNGPSGITPSANTQLVIEGAAQAGITIANNGTGQGHIFFGDVGDNDIGRIEYFHNGNIMEFSVAGNEWLRATAAEVTVNEGSANRNFRIEGNGNAQVFFVDAANDRIGIGTLTPGNLLHIGDGTNNTQVGATGTTYAGTARHRKEYVYAKADLGLGGSDDPGAILINNFAMHQFDSGSDRETFIIFTLPPEYDDGTDIICQFNWSPADASAGDVIWAIDSRAISPNNTELITGAVVTNTVTDATDTAQDEALQSGNVTITGTAFVSGDVLALRVYRNGANGSDTYGDSANLHTFVMNHEVDQLGGAI